MIYCIYYSISHILQEDKMKYIKIFLASSIVELEAERLKLSDFIRALNDNYVPPGVLF